MTKYSIGPLHFSFSCSFEWRTKRHNRIFRAVDAYCRYHPIVINKPVIVEWELYVHCDGREPCLHSGKELLSVLRELQRRGYGAILHENLIAPNELWEFFQWVRVNGAPEMRKIDGVMTPVVGHVLGDACDLHVEVYRWRYPGKLDPR